MVNGGLHAPTALLQGKSSCTHRTEGWVGPRASLDRFGKRKSLYPAGIRKQDRTVRSLDNDSENNY
jgi:hypothetical protein